MGKIYELATKVVMWLGPTAGDSSLAIEMLANLGSMIVANWLSYTIAPAKDLGPDDLHWGDPAYRLPYQEEETRH
jgi:hypothetical protein